MSFETVTGEDIPPEYYINFTTQEGKLEGIRVRVDMQPISMNQKVRIDLCNHPLYKELESYVKDNPSH
jgi:hypothetical protein